MAVLDLTAKRLERLEKAQVETNRRLDDVQDSLRSMVTILEAHSRHFERMEDAMIGISERVDRLTAAIARGRTQDLRRLDDHEGRLRKLETRTPRRRPPAG